MALDSVKVGMLLKMIQNTHDVELSCPEVAAELDHYVQRILDGESIEGLLKLVKEHLEACSGCDDEFQVILDTIRAIEES